MATHSGILAWEISWTEEPGGLQSLGSQRVRHDRATNTHTHTHTRISYDYHYCQIPLATHSLVCFTELLTHSTTFSGSLAPSE